MRSATIWSARSETAQKAKIAAPTPPMSMAIASPTNGLPENQVPATAKNAPMSMKAFQRDVGDAAERLRAGRPWPQRPAVRRSAGHAREQRHRKEVGQSVQGSSSGPIGRRLGAGGIRSSGGSSAGIIGGASRDAARLGVAWRRALRNCCTAASAETEKITKPGEHIDDVRNTGRVLHPVGASGQGPEEAGQHDAKGLIAPNQADGDGWKSTRMRRYKSGRAAPARVHGFTQARQCPLMSMATAMVRPQENLADGTFRNWRPTVRSLYPKTAVEQVPDHDGGNGWRR